VKENPRDGHCLCDIGRHIWLPEPARSDNDCMQSVMWIEQFSGSSSKRALTNDGPQDSRWSSRCRRILQALFCPEQIRSGSGRPLFVLMQPCAFLASSPTADIAAYRPIGAVDLRAFIISQRCPSSHHPTSYTRFLFLSAQLSNRHPALCTPTPRSFTLCTVNTARDEGRSAFRPSWRCCLHPRIA
jgi:hypothetical protein